MQLTWLSISCLSLQVVTLIICSLNVHKGLTEYLTEQKIVTLGLLLANSCYLCGVGLKTFLTVIVPDVDYICVGISNGVIILGSLFSILPMQSMALRLFDISLLKWLPTLTVILHVISVGPNYYWTFLRGFASNSVQLWYYLGYILWCLFCVSYDCSHAYMTWNVATSKITLRKDPLVAQTMIDLKRSIRFWLFWLVMTDIIGWSMFSYGTVVDKSLNRIFIIHISICFPVFHVYAIDCILDLTKDLLLLRAGREVRRPRKRFSFRLDRTRSEISAKPLRDQSVRDTQKESVYDSNLPKTEPMGRIA
ncbi:hypothetical protein EDD86DRAFT_127119 [Gorgonomyces haynaldii]|nr:hypothetical protein EDD86DRAFT_127119 [Gorgonomyces haynaldii]